MLYKIGDFVTDSKRDDVKDVIRRFSKVMCSVYVNIGCPVTVKMWQLQIFTMNAEGRFCYWKL